MKGRLGRRVANSAAVEVDYVAAFCRFGRMVSDKGSLKLELLLEVENKRHTIVSLHTHIFPEALLHCCTGLHVTCSHVSSTLKKLGLPPTAIDSLAILGDSGHGSWGRGTCCRDGERYGAPGRRGMEALEERGRDGRKRSTTCRGYCRR